MKNNVEPTEEEKENAKTISLDGMGVLPSNEDELTRYGKRELKNLTSVISQALAEQRGKFEQRIQELEKLAVGHIGNTTTEARGAERERERAKVLIENLERHHEHIERDGCRVCDALDQYRRGE